MGHLVIACYRAKPGKREALRELMRHHLSGLRAEGLVSDRQALLGQAEDGTFVEVFEWISEEAVARAHETPSVLATWKRFEAVCEYVPIARVPGADRVFTGLRSVDFDI